MDCYRKCFVCDLSVAKTINTADTQIYSFVAACLAQERKNRFLNFIYGDKSADNGRMNGSF